MITAITPTGDRPLAISLCCRWMEAQTRQPDQWIIVDDGKMETYKSLPDFSPRFDGLCYVRRVPGQNDPRFTLSENLKTAISYISGEKILIIEDDEYYAPKYIETVSRYLNKSEVAGIGKSRYYHLPSGGYMIIGNMGHASLAQTGFRKSFMPEFAKVLSPGKLYIDYAVWKAAKSRRSARIFYDKPPLYVGMKGLPGRAGIGRGHDPRIYRKRDAGRKVLKQWIPKDYRVYLDILNGGKND